MPAGSQLPRLCGEGGGRAEETAGGVRNQQPLKAAKSVAKLYLLKFFFLYLNISRGQRLAAAGERFLLRTLCSVKRRAVVS